MTPMSDIRIRRFEDHPHNWVGAIEPKDKRWQLCIDEQGLPKLFVRIFAEVDGKRVAGLLDVDQANEIQIADLVDSFAEGGLTPEEEAQAWEEIQEEGYRCPANLDSEG